LLYQLNGSVHSLLAGLQRKSHASVLAGSVPSPPIFILGFWRSGTTFLHELLCCDPQFGFPSTYACLNPSHFLLSERRIGHRSIEEHTRRPMDNMRYSWASPQEDEFALLAMGAPSPYEALLVPSLMRHPRSLLDLSHSSAQAQARWSSTLRYFLQLLTVQQAKPMVLKSPSHGFRLCSLRRLFPKARYIIIERNPYEVFASNLKLWHTLLESYSLEHFSADEIEEFVLEAYVLHEQAISDGASDLDRRDLARVRYEDLVAEPAAEVARLYDELALGDFANARAAVERHLASVSDYKPNQFRLSLAQKARVDRTWGKTISAKGYHWPENRLGLGEGFAIKKEPA
jgi:omega-hydroxy-beta-dihydromenaquinone-9 sulfotransferase